MKTEVIDIPDFIQSQSTSFNPPTYNPLEDFYYNHEEQQQKYNADYLKVIKDDVLAFRPNNTSYIDKWKNRLGRVRLLKSLLLPFNINHDLSAYISIPILQIIIQLALSIFAIPILFLAFIILWIMYSFLISLSSIIALVFVFLLLSKWFSESNFLKLDNQYFNMIEKGVSTLNFQHKQYTLPSLIPYFIYIFSDKQQKQIYFVKSIIYQNRLQYLIDIKGLEKFIIEDKGVEVLAYYREKGLSKKSIGDIVLKEYGVDLIQMENIIAQFKQQ